jgi:hypothetical protein
MENNPKTLQEIYSSIDASDNPLRDAVEKLKMAPCNRKWCAICGKFGDHSSGACPRALAADLFAGHTRNCPAALGGVCLCSIGHID